MSLRLKGKRLSPSCYNQSKESHKKKSESIKALFRNGKMKAKKGSDSPRWNGGRYVAGSGYVFVKCPDHPRPNKADYVLEHILVIEKYIGRYLKPEERVHHIDGNKSNNDVTNLMLFSNTSEHKKFHDQMERLGMKIYSESLKNKCSSPTQS